MSEIKDTSKLVADAVEESTNKPKTIKLSSGVVLKMKKAPLGVFIKVAARYTRPEVYKIWVETEKRWFENPDHPDYIAAVKAYESKINDVMLNAIILLATELESKPKGMGGPESESWLDVFGALGLETHTDSKGWRYINWILTNAIITQEDFKLITEVANASGIAISEEAVAEAANFPGRD
jgi:hypothetical protein